MMRGVFDPNIRRHLLREEGEVIVDEVRHHWIVYVRPTLEAAARRWRCSSRCPFVDMDLAWFPFALAFGALGARRVARAAASTWTAS